MELGKLGNLEIDWKWIYNKRDLSYRMYKNLSDKDKQRLVGLTPNELMLALKIHKLYHIPLRKVIRKLDELYVSYFKWLPTRNTPYQKYSKEKYLAKEFKFRGFVPEEDYPQSLDTRKYCYITSNSKIENTIWVYPMKFYLSYDIMQKAIKKGKDISDKHIYPNFEAIALEGNTQIKYQDL